MANVSVLIKITFILSLINSYSAEICSNIDQKMYYTIEFNNLIHIVLEPEEEICYKCWLPQNKKFIGISFQIGNSYTVKVLIYDSYKKITKDQGNYISNIDSFVVGLKDFHEVDVSNFEENVMYLIIKQNKSYYFSDYIKLYNSESSLPLIENTPITINKFMSNKRYGFFFNSKKNIKIFYSSKIKGQKQFTLIKNEEEPLKKLDNNDIMIKSDSSNLNVNYNIYIDLVSDKIDIDQEFSIMYCENFEKFKEIKYPQREQIYYLSNDITEQIFLFYVNTFSSSSYTINFKIDYNHKVNNYIEITTNKASNLPERDYDFKENELPSTFDRDSDENLRYYFKNQKYILIKVKINRQKDYRKPNYFNIAYSGPVDIIGIQPEQENYSPFQYVPRYINFYARNSEKYLFYAPYEDYCLLLKGEIFENNNINTNYIDEPSDLHELDANNTNFTAILLPGKKSVKFIFHKYEPNDVFILNRNDRIKEAFSKTFTKGECDGNNKYIIIKYDILYFSIGQNYFFNYWTTDGDMEVYYNNTLNEKDFFPNLENKLEKEILYNSSNHLDLFTIKCKSPGNFYIRPLKKTYKETTHEISENSVNEFETFLGTEIIQLYSPIKDAFPHIYFSILTLSENQITISPDTPGLFKETIIDNKSKFFSLEINTKLYKMDQMGIKLTSNSNNIIEVTEITDCPYCTYQKISIEKSDKNLKINKNNFVIFFEEKVASFSITINNLKGEEVAYGIVDLPTNNINYIPLAYKLKQIENERIKDTFSIAIDVDTKKDQFKPYKAFVFSLMKNEITNYNMDIKFQYKPNDKLFSIILISCLGFAAVLAIVIIIVVILAKMKRKRDIIDNINDDDGFDKLVP